MSVLGQTPIGQHGLDNRTAEVSFTTGLRSVQLRLQDNWLSTIIGYPGHNISILLW